MRTHQLLPVTVLLIATIAGCTSKSADGNGPAATGRPTTAVTGSPPPPATVNQEPRKSALPTVPAAADLRAEALSSATRCGPAGTQTSFVDLSWRPAKSTGAQRVVYSPYADGYRTGRYETTPDLAPDATSATLQQLSPGSAYTWLVLTKHGESWDASETAQFLAPICVADEGDGG